MTGVFNKIHTMQKLFLSIALVSARTLAIGQVPGDTLLMHFETGATLQLDSVYPAGCWQIGAPSKPIFTSAWNPPNALVTDTIQPHAANVTCYAEFTATFTQAWDYPGRSIQFRHRLDMDSLESLAWLEHSGPWTSDWVRAGVVQNELAALYPPEGALWTDSGFVFSGTNTEWADATVDLHCLAVVAPDDGERQGGNGTVRLRFVFKGNGNPNGRDGWMIDDVRVSTLYCFGSVDEHGRASISVHPNPATDRVRFDGLPAGPGPFELEVIDAAGRNVSSGLSLPGPQAELDVSHLDPGHYLCLVRTGKVLYTAPLVVAR